MVENRALLNLYWPKGANGAVLMTTRDSEVARLFPASKIEVQPLSEVASREILLKIAYEGTDENYKPTIADMTTADKVANALGNLPLALDLVGSYAASSGMTLPRFLDVHNEYDRKFIFRDSASPRRDVQTHQRHLNSIFPSNRELLGPSTCLLIDLLAFFDPDGVPTALFHPKPRERKYV